MSIHPFGLQIGEIRCTPISDGGSPFPAALVFSNMSDEERTHLLSTHNLSLNEVACAYTCLLIQTQRNTVLVDTGGGNLVPGGGKLLQNVESAGVCVSDVDTVILTHAHPDHIAGVLTAEGNLAFPNARFVMWKKEWDFWTADNIDLSGSQLPEAFKNSLLIPAARRFLPPIRNRVELIERETEIVPGVTLVPAHGHTPGHAAVLIASGQESFLHLGDAVFHPVHLENPLWQTAFDLEQDEAASTRRLLLDRACADRMRVMAYHFPFPGVGNVVTRQPGWTWVPISPDQASFSSVA